MEEKKKLHKIILFVICLFFVALIIAIILPAFHKSKDSGPGYAKNMCLSNVKQIATGCLVYQMDENSWPNKEHWNDSIKAYVGNEDVLRCYNDKIGPCSYAMNENIPADANSLPDDLVLLFESAPGWNQIGEPEDVVTDRHGKPGANIAFADGHVEFVEAEDIPKLRWTVEEK